MTVLIGSELVEFLGCNARIQTEADLHDLMMETTRRLGFEQFALVSHVDLVAAQDHAVAISNYPEGWIERILSKRYYLDDPVHAASSGRTTPFAWHTIGQILMPTRRQHAILKEGGEYGLNDGVTVPVHLPGEYRGTCSFATSRPFTMTPHIQGATHIVAGYAFETARMLVRMRLGNDDAVPSIPKLSPREVDCVGLIASGLGDAQIAHMLSLSEATVHQYIGDAMRKLRVFKRPSLVFRALFDGQICYHQVLRTPSE